MQEGLFRSSAVAKLSTPDRLDQGLGIVGRATWVMLAALSLLVVGGIVWGALLEVPVTVRGRGILLSPGGVLDVSAETPGRIVSFSINVGDHIKSGMVVAKLDQPDVRQELVTAKAELRDAQDEENEILEIQKRRAPILSASVAQRRQAFEESIVLVDHRLKALAERESANTYLAQKQLMPAQRVLDTQVEISRAQDEKAQAQNGLRNLDVEVSKEEIDDERERLNSELKIGAAKRKIRTLTERLDRQSVVISPYDGIVGEIKVNPGEIVEHNRPLFSLLPLNNATPESAKRTDSFGPLYAVIFVPPSDGKKIRPGMPVRISPSTVHREEVGFIEGRARAVAEIPATMEGMDRALKNRQLEQDLAKQGAPFEVIVDLHADPLTRSGYRWSSSKGPESAIDAGTLADAEIEVESMPLIGLLIPPLRQVFRPHR
jgi:HlyD family secretion protein